MSSRVTRSSTRKAADQAANQADQASPTPAAASASAAAVHTPAPSSARKKRKTQPQTSPGGTNTESPSSGHRSKRLRVTQEPPPPPPPAARPAQPAPVAAPRRRKGKAPATMSSPEYVAARSLSVPHLPGSLADFLQVRRRPPPATQKATRTPSRHPRVEGPAATSKIHKEG